MERCIRLIIIINSYNDLVLKREVCKGEIIKVDRDRAIKLCKLKYAKIYSITKE